MTEVEKSGALADMAHPSDDEKEALHAAAVEARLLAAEREHQILELTKKLQYYERPMEDGEENEYNELLEIANSHIEEQNFPSALEVYMGAWSSLWTRYDREKKRSRLRAEADEEAKTQFLNAEAEYKKSIQDLEAKLDAQREELDTELQRSQAEANAELEALRRELAMEREVREQCERRINEDEHEKGKLRAEMQTLKVQFEQDLDQVMKQRAEIESNLRASEDKYAELVRQGKEKAKRTRELLDKHKTLKEETTRKDEQLKVLQDQGLNKDEELRATKAQVEDANKQVTELNDLLQRANERVEEFAQQLSSKNEEIASLSSQNAALSSANQIEAASRLAGLAANQARLEEMQQQIVNMRARVEEESFLRREEADAAMRTIETLQSEKVEVQAKLDAMSVLAEQHATRINELIEIQNKLSETQAQEIVGAREAAQLEFQGQIQSLQEALAAAESNLELSDTALAEAQQATVAELARVIAADQHVAALLAERESINERVRTLEESVGRAKTLETEHAELQRKLSAVEEQLQQLRIENASLVDEIKSVRALNDTLKDDVEKKSADEALLNDLKTKLQQAGDQVIRKEAELSVLRNAHVSEAVAHAAPLFIANSARLAELEAANSGSPEKESLIAQKDAEILRLNSEAEEVHSQLHQVQENVERLSKELVATVEQSKRDRDEYQIALDDARKSLQVANDIIAQKENELQRVRSHEESEHNAHQELQAKVAEAETVCSQLRADLEEERGRLAHSSAQYNELSSERDRLKHKLEQELLVRLPALEANAARLQELEESLKELKQVHDELEQALNETRSRSEARIFELEADLRRARDELDMSESIAKQAGHVDGAIETKSRRSSLGDLTARRSRTASMDDPALLARAEREEAHQREKDLRLECEALRRRVAELTSATARDTPYPAPLVGNQTLEIATRGDTFEDAEQLEAQMPNDSSDAVATARVADLEAELRRVRAEAAETNRDLQAECEALRRRVEELSRGIQGSSDTDQPVRPKTNAQRFKQQHHLAVEGTPESQSSRAMALDGSLPKMQPLDNDDKTERERLLENELRRVRAESSSAVKDLQTECEALHRRLDEVTLKETEEQSASVEISHQVSLRNRSLSELEAQENTSEVSEVQAITSNPIRASRLMTTPKPKRRASHDASLRPDVERTSPSIYEARINELTARLTIQTALAQEAVQAKSELNRANESLLSLEVEVSRLQQKLTLVEGEKVQLEQELEKLSAETQALSQSLANATTKQGEAGTVDGADASGDEHVKHATITPDEALRTRVAELEAVSRTKDAELREALEKLQAGNEALDDLRTSLQDTQTRFHALGSRAQTLAKSVERLQTERDAMQRQVEAAYGSAIGELDSAIDAAHEASDDALLAAKTLADELGVATGDDDLAMTISEALKDAQACLDLALRLHRETEPSGPSQEAVLESEIIVTTTSKPEGLNGTIQLSETLAPSSESILPTVDPGSDIFKARVLALEQEKADLIAQLARAETELAMRKDLFGFVDRNYEPLPSQMPREVDFTTPSKPLNSIFPGLEQRSASLTPWRGPAFAIPKSEPTAVEPAETGEMVVAGDSAPVWEAGNSDAGYVAEESHWVDYGAPQYTEGSHEISEAPNATMAAEVVHDVPPIPPSERIVDTTLPKPPSVGDERRIKASERKEKKKSEGPGILAIAFGLGTYHPEWKPDPKELEEYNSDFEEDEQKEVEGPHNIPSSQATSELPGAISDPFSAAARPHSNNNSPRSFSNADPFARPERRRSSFNEHDAANPFRPAQRRLSDAQADPFQNASRARAVSSDRADPFQSHPPARPLENSDPFFNSTESRRRTSSVGTIPADPFGARQVEVIQPEQPYSEAHGASWENQPQHADQWSNHGAWSQDPANDFQEQQAHVLVEQEQYIDEMSPSTAAQEAQETAEKMHHLTTAVQEHERRAAQLEQELAEAMRKSEAIQEELLAEREARLLREAQFEAAESSLVTVVREADELKRRVAAMEQELGDARLRLEEAAKALAEANQRTFDTQHGTEENDNAGSEQAPGDLQETKEEHDEDLMRRMFEDALRAKEQEFSSVRSALESQLQEALATVEDLRRRVADVALVGPASTEAASNVALEEVQRALKEREEDIIRLTAQLGHITYDAFRQTKHKDQRSWRGTLSAAAIAFVMSATFPTDAFALNLTNMIQGQSS